MSKSLMSRSIHPARPTVHNTIRGGLLLIGLLGLASCAYEPQRLVSVRQSASAPDTNVYFYPAAGHPAPSAQQQDRDKYECNEWAVQQTHFDPSVPNLPPQQRVVVVAGGPPPGSGVAVGAVTGAVIGAAVSNPWHAGGNTLIGALAGAAIGGIADAERSEQANGMQAQANADANGAASAVLDKRAFEYRRAMSACLEGRGYSVQ
jgi:Glycine zipper 2TM domain